MNSKVLRVKCKEKKLEICLIWTRTCVAIVDIFLKKILLKTLVINSSLPGPMVKVKMQVWGNNKGGIMIEYIFALTGMVTLKNNNFNRLNYNKIGFGTLETTIFPSILL